MAYTFIINPVNMGDKTGGVVWCSSGIIFVSCCDSGVWIGQVKCVPFALMLVHLEAGNHHNYVLQLDTMEVWHHIVIGVGSGICGIFNFTRYTHYNVIYLYY